MVTAKIIVRFDKIKKGAGDYRMEFVSAEIKVPRLEEMGAILSLPTKIEHLEICMAEKLNNRDFHGPINVDFSPKIWEFLHSDNFSFEKYNCELAIGHNAHGMLIRNCESEFATKFLALFPNLLINVRVKIACLFQWAEFGRFIRKITPMEGCKKLIMGRGVCEISAYTLEMFAWVHAHSGRHLFMETRFESPHHVDGLLDRVKKAFINAKHCHEFTVQYLWDDYEELTSDEEWYQKQPFQEFSMKNTTTKEVLSLKFGHYGAKMGIGEFTLKRTKMEEEVNLACKGKATCSLKEKEKKDEQIEVKETKEESKQWFRFDIGR